MATQTYTDGVTLTAAAEFNNFDSVAYSVLSGVGGTANAITATGPANYTLSATRPPIWFIPANTNTAATTINVTPSGSASLGAKNIFWNGAACVGGEIRQNVPVAVIYDGTQYHIVASGFQAPFLDTHPVVEGSADSTKKVRFEVDGLTTATTRVLTVLDADFSIGSATQAQQEAGTSAVVAVTPSVQQFHQSAAKAWVQYDSSGTLTSSYNMTSVTDNGAGNLSPVWNVDFSGGAYCVQASHLAASAATAATTWVTQILSIVAGGCNIATIRLSDFTQVDVSYVMVAAYGDQ